MIYTADSFEQLPTSIKNQWESLEMSKDIKKKWLKACEKAIKNYTPFYYVKEVSGSIEVVIVGSVIKELDCLQFIKDEVVIRKILEDREKNINCYKYDVLFIGGPMSMESGTYFSKNVEYSNAFKEFKNYIFDSNIADGIFYTNVDIDNKILEQEHTISFLYYPNTMLKLTFESFEDYLNHLKAKKRWDIKNKQKVFKELGGTIEILPNSKIEETQYSALYELYSNTEKNNVDTASYEHYCENDKFQSFKYLTDDFTWIIAKKDDKIIGFALLVSDGSKLTLKHIGLDYAINRTIYSYFNLFFRTIKFGIDNNYQYIFCGSTTYDVKKSLGCELVNRRAYISLSVSKNTDISYLYSLDLG